MSTGVPGFFGLKAESNFPPVIDSVTLTELSPGNDVLFGNQSFSVDVVMTIDGKPLAGKSLKAYIDGTFNEPVLTDYLTFANFYQTSTGQTFYAVDASGAQFNGGVGSPTTSNFVSVARFLEVYYVGSSRITQNHFLAVTDDNQLAYSSNSVKWEVRNAGITNAIFRKVQPLYKAGAGSTNPTGNPVFVACGQISGGDYFLATCNNNATFVVDLTLTDEIISLARGRDGGVYAGTANELYLNEGYTGWTLIQSGAGPYQYNNGTFSVINGVLRVGGNPIGTGITGGFDDIHDAGVSSNINAKAITGLGGVVEFFESSSSESATQISTTATSSSQYYAQVFDDDAWNSRRLSSALVSAGAITFENYSTGGSSITDAGIDSNATLTYARDAAFKEWIDGNAYYPNPSNIGVFVGNGGQIIFAVHEYAIAQFSSDLNFSSIDEYDTLTLAYRDTEYPSSTWFVLNKYSTSMKLIPTGDFRDIPLVQPTDIRYRGGSVTTSAARRYLQMINYDGVYNNVESLLDSDPGFTDQRTTGTDIPDIRFPATYANQDGFINRFEDVVDSGATLTVELQASNAYGSDAGSDTVTPS